MNQSIATFMMIAAVVMILITLLFGIAYQSLEQKNSQNEKMLQTEHQLKLK